MISAKSRILISYIPETFCVGSVGQYIFPINSDYSLISSLSRSGRIHATEDKKHAQLKINTAADDNHVTANKTNQCF